MRNMPGPRMTQYRTITIWNCSPANTIPRAVREALRQLELEGLVTIIPNKGAYVVGISQKDIKDIYEIRSRLEGLCAKWAAENITKEQLDELEENIFLSDFHATKGNAEQMVELDNKFHEILYTASGSRELRHLIHHCSH